MEDLEILMYGFIGTVMFLLTVGFIVYTNLEVFIKCINGFEEED